jgi:hypothetical protein
MGKRTAESAEVAEGWSNGQVGKWLNGERQTGLSEEGPRDRGIERSRHRGGVRGIGAEWRVLVGFAWSGLDVPALRAACRRVSCIGQSLACEKTLLERGGRRRRLHSSKSIIRPGVPCAWT